MPTTIETVRIGDPLTIECDGQRHTGTVIELGQHYVCIKTQTTQVFSVWSNVIASG